MSNLAIITARSGSKGLADKNIKPLSGKPLIAYTIEAALGARVFDEVMVSTDSQEYATIALDYGASVPFLRSEQLSNDTASSWEVVKDVLAKYAEAGKNFDTVTLLQPTSPLRSAEDIVEGHRLLGEKNADAVIAVCEMEHSPLWSNTLPGDLSMSGFIDEDILKKNRQALPTYYRINGALYIMRTEYLLNDGNPYGDRSYALVMPKANSIDIDDMEDFLMAEFLLNYRKKMAQ